MARSVSTTARQLARPRLRCAAAQPAAPAHHVAQAALSEPLPGDGRQPWLWYTVTAANQLHVAISHARDDADALRQPDHADRWIALCANSPVYAGKEDPTCNAREGVMAAIRANEHRHGMLVRPMHDLADFIETIAQATYLDRPRQR